MQNLKISVLDVGHGDFIYAETPFGHSLVIDCGSGDVVPAEFLAKIQTIHELQISHPHEDHFTDIVALSGKTISSFRCPSLDGFTDDKMSWRTKDKNKIKVLRSLKETIGKNDAAVPCKDGFQHLVFSPSAAAVNYDDPNTASLATILSYGEFKMLFGGDLPTAGWDDLLTNQNFRNAIAGTTVLKVSHHGREVGYSDALFKVISPMLCVVSDKTIDQTNENTQCIQKYNSKTSGIRFTAPDGTVSDRKVLTTRCDGSIHLSADASGKWKCHLKTRWQKD